jgi:hypothetical protein
MKRQRYDIPPERQRQFDLIAAASNSTLHWAHDQAIHLERIEPVVSFVETDFGLDAWLFLDTEAHVEQYRLDGTSERLVSRFESDLLSVGYPEEWSSQVKCHFGSKEVVDRDYQGSYFYFLR